jgi:siroheme synthase-like protein
VNFHYPIFLDLTGKRCLVVGEGPEMASKIRGLIEAGAEVVYVNPRASDEIAALAKRGEMLWAAREFAPPDLDGCFLVIARLEDNSEIFRLAEERGVLCNAVDDPEHCRFIFGSVHRQGELTIAISTNGVAPALAVRLKERLQREIGPEYAVLLELLQQIRAEIRARIPDFARRRELWYRIIDSGALEKIRAGEIEEARRLIVGLIERPD